MFSACTGQKRQLEDEELASAVPEKKRRPEDDDIDMDTLRQIVQTEPSKMLGPDVRKSNSLVGVVFVIVY